MNILHIVSIICLALCLLMFFYFKWYIKKRTTDTMLDERRAEFSRLIADIDRAADRDSQLVEDRIKKLDAILEEADKRIAVYVKELDKSRSAEALYTSLGRGIREALNTAAETPKQTDSEPKPEYPSDISQKYPTDTIEISSPSRAAPAVYSAAVEPVLTSYNSPDPFNKQAEVSASSETQKTPISPAARRQIRTQIDLLLDEGIAPQEIASRLGITIGEVELAVNLRRR